MCDDSWMATFHVRVCHDDYDKLQNPEIWPIGWKSRDFIRRRPARPQADSSHQGGRGGQGAQGAQGGQGVAGTDPALLNVGQLLRALQESQHLQNGEQN